MKPRDGGGNVTNWLFAFTFIFLVSIIGIQRVVELHHGYWGFIVALIGILTHQHYLALFGLIVLGEDAYQKATSRFHNHALDWSLDNPILS